MTDKRNARLEPENILGRLTALEMICISFIRQQLSTPESRRHLAESVRGVAAEFPVEANTRFAEGFKDGLPGFRG